MRVEDAVAFHTNIAPITNISAVSDNKITFFLFFTIIYSVDYFTILSISSDKPIAKEIPVVDGVLL